MGVEWFGLGKISHHSTIRSFFHLTLITSNVTTTLLSNPMVSSSDIYHHLITFLSNPLASSSQYDSAMKSVNIHKFHQYIVSIYQINQLHDIGVVFVGNFERERLALAYIVNRRKLQSIELQNKELAMMYQQQQQQQQQQRPGNTDIPISSMIVNTNSSSSSSLKSRIHSTTMKTPMNPSIQQLLQEITTSLNIKRKGSVYSPSFKQVYDSLVEDFIGSKSKQHTITAKRTGETEQDRCDHNAKQRQR